MAARITKRICGTTAMKPSRLAREIAEMADAQCRLGIVDETTYAKITARQLGKKVLPTEETPMTGPAGGERAPM